MVNKHACIYFDRYKDRYFLEEKKPQIRRLLSDVISAHFESQSEASVSSEAPDSTEPPAKTACVGTLHELFTELLEEDEELAGVRTESPALFQMNLYLSEPVMIRSGQPLIYWQENKDRFPSLARAARAFLCAPCTSVDSERLFSTAGLILDDKRNKLTSQNVEMLIFLKKNLSLIMS